MLAALTGARVGTALGVLGGTALIGVLGENA